MTIAQHFLGKNICKQQEEPLVPNEKSVTPKDVEEGRPVVVTMHAHVRRVGSLTTLCVFVTALLVLTTGIIGGVYFYRQFAHYKLRHFRGWCGVPYLPDVLDTPKHDAIVGNRLGYIATEAGEANSPRANFFEEEFDIDIKFEQYERIDVPKFSHGRKAHFIHDFVVNKTAILDSDYRRCFLMVLNRSYVHTPRILYEQLSKMRAGYYDVDTQIVRHTMQVMNPPLSDLKNVGLFIARDCATLPTYVLERANSPVYKRSLDSESKEMFVEFAGNKVNEINIINLNDATPGEKTS